MADQTNSKKSTGGKRSTKPRKKAKAKEIESSLSMLDHLAMINVRRFGLKGMKRTAYGDQIKSPEDHEQAAAPNDQPKKSD